jgi:DNA invertase Pin-like site-specific DNA recombinase
MPPFTKRRGKPASWARRRFSIGTARIDMIRERTQAGLAAARRIGRTGGRPPKLTAQDIEAAKTMLTNPDIGVTQIAHRLGVSPATLYRYIPAARTASIADDKPR